jgi:hypothetical protein
VSHFPEAFVPQDGNLVVVIATSVITMRGITARRVSKPAKTRLSQAISKVPTKGAMISGDGMPILAKLPAPTDHTHGHSPLLGTEP